MFIILRPLCIESLILYKINAPVIVKNEQYGSCAEKIYMSHFGLNLGQTAEDSEMFTNICLSSIGLSYQRTA